MQRLGDLHDFGVGDSLGLTIPGSAFDWRQGRTENVVGSSHITDGDRIIPDPVVLHDPKELILRNVICSAVQNNRVCRLSHFTLLMKFLVLGDSI